MTTRAFAANQTELDRVERALKASEERLRKLVASSADAIVVMDAAGLVVDWNPRAEAMFGWSASEATGCRVSELIIPPDMRERHEAGLQRYLRTRQTRVIGRNVELSALCRDGRVLPIELSLWPLEAGGDILFGAFVRDISARKAAQEALRQQEAKYRSVVDNVSEGILIVREGRIVFANPSTERMVGMSLEQMRELPFTHAVHPDDQALVIDRYMRRLRGEEVEQHYAIRVLRPDGRLVWIELSAVQIDWEGSSATLSFITDITERKRLEDSLQQSLIERDTILNNSIIGILFLDPDRKVRWANAAMGRMFGVEPERFVDMRGITSESFYPSAADYQRVGAAVAEAVRAGKDFEVEMQMRRADGELFWAYVSGRALDRDDLLQGTVWAVLDISQRKALEEALKRQSEEQEAILQSTLIGISLIREGCFQWVNGTLASMFGYQVPDLIGQSTALLFDQPEEWETFVAKARQALIATGAYDVSYRMRRSDGSEIWLQLQGTRLGDKSAGRGSLWTFVDISEQHRAEQDIRRALDKERELNVLKSRFVSMTSHEFRTPLTGIVSSTELLRHYHDRLSAEEKSELFDQIEHSVERMTRMLDNILLIGRAESKGLQYKPVKANLRAFLHEVTAEARAAKYPGQALPSVCLECDNLDQEFLFDPALLRHVLGNLLSNAIKYSPAGGEVRLQASWSEGQARFVVSDQGIGIPEAEQDLLFESFHRASNVGGIAGTGLGLAIVKQAAELHGGSIGLYSRPGEGSRFTVQLPLS